MGFQKRRQIVIRPMERRQNPHHSRLHWHWKICLGVYTILLLTLSGVGLGSRTCEVQAKTKFALFSIWDYKCFDGVVKLRLKVLHPKIALSRREGLRYLRARV